MWLLSKFMMQSENKNYDLWKWLNPQITICDVELNIYYIRDRQHKLRKKIIVLLLQALTL